MKKMTALLLAVLLCLGTTGTLAFADEKSTAGQTAGSAFKGGYAITPVTVPTPQSMTAGDILTFTVDPNNFENPAAFDLTKLNVFVNKSVSTPDGQTTDQDGKAYLAPQGFSRNADTGAVTFSLKAVAACDLADFSVSAGVITTKVISEEETVTGITMSSYYKFKTQIAAAIPSSSSSSSAAASSSSALSDSSSTPESSSSSTPESSSAVSDPIRSESSATSASSAAESVSSQSESSEESSVSDTESSSAPESSSQSESGSDVSSSESSSSSEAAPSSASGNQNNDNDDGGVLGGLVNFFGGLFAPAAAPAPAGIPPATIEDITGVNATGSAWSLESGFTNSKPSSTIAAGTRILFRIPYDNFATSGTTKNIDDNITAMNTNIQSNGTNSPYAVEVYDGNADQSKYFSVEFRKITISASAVDYGVWITPNMSGTNAIPSDGLLLPEGTTFYFKNATNPAKFTLAADLLIVPASTGSTRADGINTAGGAELGGNYTWITQNGQLLGSNITLTDLEGYAKAGDEFLIHFMPNYFTWTGSTPAKVTLSSIRSKISLRASMGTGGSKVFETIELTSSKGEAVVRIKFKDRIPTIRAIDYKTTIHMRTGGRSVDSLLITGTIADSDPEEFFSEDSYIYIGDGTIGKAVELIKKPEIYVGDDIYITMNILKKNTKFYGTSTCNELDENDEEIVSKYPDIVYVYKLYTVGLNGAGSSVGFDNLGGLYVYDKNFNYLGRSNQKVEYSDVYYLAAKMLDLDEYDEPDPIEIIPEDELYPVPNTNDNPSTGR